MTVLFNVLGHCALQDTSFSLCVVTFAILIGELDLFYIHSSLCGCCSLHTHCVRLVQLSYCLDYSWEGYSIVYGAKLS